MGRFYPNHFKIVGAGALMNRSDIPLCTDAFTYMDENFNVGFTIQARNADEGVTSNYETTVTYDYDKLLSGGSFGFAAINDPGGAGQPLTTRLGFGAVSGSFNNGSGVLSLPMQISRLASADGPFADTRIGAQPVDSDTVSLLAADLNLDPALSGGNTHAQLTSANLRFGRAIIENAFGTEFLSLDVPLFTQYYSSVNSGFVVNTIDNCSTFTLPNLTLSNTIEAGQVDGDIQITAGNTTTASMTNDGSAGVAGQQVANGDAGLNFSAPGVAGYTDMDVNVTVSPYLLFDWDGDSNHDNNPPRARATFGSFRGDDRIIYWQECFGLNPPAACP